MYTGGTPAVLHKLCTECLLGAQMGRNLIRVQICYANVIALVLGEVNFTMAACKLKLHPLNSKLVFWWCCWPSIQYQISTEIYQNVLCSAVWEISNSLAVSGGALCLGHGWHRHFMAYSAFWGCLSWGCECLVIKTRREILGTKMFQLTWFSWWTKCHLCFMELLLEMVLKLLGNSRNSWESPGAS